MALEDRLEVASEAGSTFTEGSWRDLPSLGHREILARPFDPAAQTLADFEATLYRAVGVLVARGEITPEDRLHLTEQGHVAKLREKYALLGAEGPARMREDLSSALEASDDNAEARLTVKTLVEFLAAASACVGTALTPQTPPPGLRSPLRAAAVAGDAAAAPQSAAGNQESLAPRRVFFDDSAGGLETVVGLPRRVAQGEPQQDAVDALASVVPKFVEASSA